MHCVSAGPWVNFPAFAVARPALGTTPSRNCASKPQHVQCANRVANRVDDIGGYAWVWLAAALMLIIAVGSTYLRIETLAASELAPAVNAGAALFGETPSAAAVADTSGVAAATAQHNASLTAFILLGAIFLTTQIVGMAVGYRYGFAGKQGLDAYRATRGCADYEFYWAPIQGRINLINTRLKRLQRMLEEGMPREVDFCKSFPDFIREERARGATDLHEPPPQAISPATPPLGSLRAEVGEAMDEMDRLAPDKDAQIAYAKTLAEPVAADLANAMRARKAVTMSERDREIHDKVTAMFADIL